MKVWLVRAGANGEYEGKFASDGKIYLTWDGLDQDLRKPADRPALIDLLRQKYPESGQGRLRNHASQIWPFARSMGRGDWVVVPRKTDRTIWIGEVTGDYVFDPHAEDPFFHSRAVKWIKEGVPRANFGQDLLHSFGAFMTVCNIERNNAVERLRKMAANGWTAEQTSDVIAKPKPKADDSGVESEPEADVDLEAAGLDQIARLIMARFKGHGLTRLVEAVLKAQGYTTFRSPEGADTGVDILAGSGALGFDEPRLCVQVKSHVSTPAGIKEYNELHGAMHNVGASQGLFVSWAGYAQSLLNKTVA